MKLVPKRKMLHVNPDTLMDIIQNAYNTSASVITGDSGGGSGVQFSGIVCQIDGGGDPIATGVKAYIPIPFNCTIVAAELEADQTGSIQIDIWKDVIGNFPPTNADTITGSNEPAISGGLTDFDSTLSGWTKDLARFDILGFNVDSCATITFCTLTLHVKRT